MCGIVGLAAYGGTLTKAQENMRQEAMIFLGTELLRLTESRGKDATGIAALRSDGDFMGLKMGVAASEFISRFGGTENDFAGFTQLWREGKPVRIMIGHCRKSSVGNSTDNVNNHPIKVGEIVGIHNGTLQNHEIIIEMLGNKRDGRVDSEAIFRLMNHFTNKSTEPFTPETILEVCRRLEGQYACLAFNGNNPYQLASFRDGRPTEYAYIRPLKLLVIASKKDFFEEAFCTFNREVNLFGNKRKFPHLSMEDVDFKTLPSDNLNIFDLSQKVDDSTKIGDLIDFVRIPYNKIWTNALMAKAPKSSKTATNTNNGAKKTTTGPTSKVATKTAPKEVKSSNTSVQEEESGNPVGRIWVKGLKRYRVVDAGEIEKVEALGCIELATDDANEVVVVKNKKTVMAEEVNIESTIADAAEIQEIKFKDNDDPTVTNNKVAATTQEVDMAVDPVAIEMATEALKNMDRYGNDEDVATELETANANVLKNMPLFSVANRIKKMAFRLGFITCAKMMKKKTNDKSSVVSSNIVQKHIRILKVITALMSKIVNRKISPASSEFHEEIEIAVQNALSKNSELNSKTFANIFTEGDLRGDPALRQVKRSIRMKENR